tara:strand:+ start:2915 stop:3094 length:180 start_codon:yes stop_codon:yes gene_type:complete
MSDKNYSIAVFDLNFYRVDEDGNAEQDAQGRIKIYDCPDYDCSYLAEGLELEDLEVLEP